MTRIGLISDTHSHLDPKVFEYFKDCDEIWHAGDVGDFEVIQQLAAFKPVRGVYGNIDGHDVRAQYPLDNRFTIEGVDVWITHIGGYPGKYSGRVKSILESLPTKLTLKSVLKLSGFTKLAFLSKLQAGSLATLFIK